MFSQTHLSGELRAFFSTAKHNDDIGVSINGGTQNGLFINIINPTILYLLLPF